MKNKILNIISLLFLPVHIFAQFYIGANSGVNISDAQDQKYIFYDNNSIQLQKILVNDVEGAFSFLNDLNLSYWASDNILNNYGIRFDYSSWTYSSYVEEFPSNIVPPINMLEQERVSYFISLLRKINLVNETKHFSNTTSFFYIGIGGGFVHSEVKYGADNIGVGYHLLSGISYPIISNLCIIIESKFTMTPDVDETPKPGWQVHTSGTKTPFRLGPHLDTRFFGLTFGVNYRLY
jgi:hypothetical protein